MDHPCQKIVEEVIEQTISVQQIPSPTFEEEKLALYVKSRFKEEGYENLKIDTQGNIYGRIKGNGGRPVIVSAHMDTVFDATCDLTITKENNRIYGPGIGDNSLGVACLILMKKILSCLDTPRLEGDIILVGNVCEEGLGDLKGMRALINETKNENPIAYIALEGTSGANCIYMQGIGSRRYKITANAQGGHSWNDFGNSSAIHALCVLGARLSDLNPSTAPKSSFNIGVIEGGMSVNTIAQTAYLMLDLRSESQAGLEDLINQTQTILTQFSMNEVKIVCEQIGDRPSGKAPDNSQLIQLCRDVFVETGFEANAKAGSTDANIPFSMGIPAVCFGISNGKDAHTPNEYLMTDNMDKSIEKVGKIISRVWQI